MGIAGAAVCSPFALGRVGALFYEFYAQTMVGGKWLCVVVKYLGTGAFVVTAYLTDKPKAGEELWPIK